MLFALACRANAAEIAVSEFQVKALFLFNFAKYVEWPADTFPSPASPLVIGIAGESRITAEAQKVVANRNIDGHPIVVRQLEKDHGPEFCHILFINSSEKTRFPDLLDQLKAKSVLTVSDIARFAQEGGVIGFVKKDDRIRLEINLAAAQRAHLQLSSKLLSVADTVRGQNQEP